jgi:RNA polymerase sigma factor (sigma-70 family)
MAIRAMDRVLGSVRRRALLADSAWLSDGQLLESFLANRDEAAFEGLVRRHGAMVLGVCRRVLGNYHDAEDAFQAAFLVLAKKAATVVPRELVGNWLYGVAYRTALEARVRLGRRRARERQVKDMPQPIAPPALESLELQRFLDQELDKLPGKYRAAIVLCDLEGRSRKDVARHLSIPEGTLSSRLAMGRQLLARRLGRRGLTLSSAGLAAALSAKAASAAVPPALIAAAVKAGAVALGGPAAGVLLSPHVVALSQGVMKSMLLSKLKIVTTVFLGFALAVWGAGLLAVPGSLGQAVVQAGEPSKSASPAGRPAAADEEPLDPKLLFEKRVQEELRLSKNQIDKLNAASKDADGKNAAGFDEIKRAEEAIKELQAKIRKMQSSIEENRAQTLRKAVPEILSAKALQRLREIQRQRQGVEALLRDPRMQRALSINDEQEMQIENILKTAKKVYTLREFVPEVHFLHSTTTRVFVDDFDAGHDPEIINKLVRVLTEDQKRALRMLVGAPFDSPGFRALLEGEKQLGGEKRLKK